MSLFDQLETAANDLIIAGDYKRAALYRNMPGGGTEASPAAPNDGFNADYKLEPVYLRQIGVAMSQAPSPRGSLYIGTTRDTDIRDNDVIEIINPSLQRDRYIVQGHKRTEEHTLLELIEVADGA